MTATVEVAPLEDFLTRRPFILGLVHHINGLAKIALNELPAPRVLAVDAPWGYGKSWIAEQLRKELQSNDKDRRVAFIDAFRHDHHQDVFAVIASAVMKSLDPNNAEKKKLLSAAGAVLKSVAPIAVKTVLNIGFKIVGTDTEEMSDAFADAKDATVEGASKFSAKAVEKMFESYTSTEQIQRRFLDALSEVTKPLPHPFVVIIDELDRCRPTFALEVLERIKHLFSAENVVFVLFWNSRSIHESIKHTYGRDTEAEAYLSKFVALGIPVPIEPAASHDPYSRYSTFIGKELSRVVRNRALPFDLFPRALAEYAEAFDASLRDVQKAIHYFAQQHPGHNVRYVDFAFFALLRAQSELRFSRVLLQNPKALKEEAELLRPAYIGRSNGYAAETYAFLEFLSDKAKYEALYNKQSNGESIAAAEGDVLSKAHGGHKAFLRAGQELQQELLRPNAPAQHEPRA